MVNFDFNLIFIFNFLKLTAQLLGPCIQRNRISVNGRDAKCRREYTPARSHDLQGIRRCK